MSRDRLEYKRGSVFYYGERLDIGRGVIVYGMLIWVAWSVGPWEWALGIFIAGWLTNLAVAGMFLFVRRLEKRRAYGKK